MPATRSQSVAPRADPLTTPSPPRAHHHPLHNSDSLTIFSSDLEESTTPVKSKRQHKTQRQRPPKPAIVPGEIIEISDDDDPPSHLNSQASMIADFRRQINKLREESVKQKKDHERAVRELNKLREENQQLQTLRKPGTLMDVAHLTDSLDCEICTSRMWAPYFLPNCGHTFCQSCLQDWFSTCLAQFMNAHPHYDVNAYQNLPHLQGLIQTLIQHPQAATHPQVAGMLKNILPPSPQYTCPTCREPVHTRPTEAFTLKAVVRVVAAATGESSPKKHNAEKPKGKAAAIAAGPWDGFFPRKTT